MEKACIVGRTKPEMLSNLFYQLRRVVGWRRKTRPEKPHIQPFFSPQFSKKSGFDFWAYNQGIIWA